MKNNHAFSRLTMSLICSRPSFMNDFEKFETELNELYGDYVLKFRILSYLEKELEGHFRNQREKVQVRCKRKFSN